MMIFTNKHRYNYNGISYNQKKNKNYRMFNMISIAIQFAHNF